MIKLFDGVIFDGNEIYYKEETICFRKKHIKRTEAEYIEHRKAWTREYVKNKKKNDSNFKITCTLRSRIRSAIKNDNAIKSGKTIELLGCSVLECRNHLKSQFTEGMDWNNHGDWHIDHIIPCASFDLTDPEQQKICFHYSNLQPLWAFDNLSKGVKIKRKNEDDK